MKESQNKVEALLQYEKDILNLFKGEEKNKLIVLFDKMRTLIKKIEEKVA